MGNNYSNQIAHLSQSDKIPIADLIKLGGKFKNVHSKYISILRSVSGVTSTISSSTLIWMILRSHKGLSTTQHRLLFVLCIYDITSSLSYSTFNSMVPYEMNYGVWNASGNDITCTTQGFLANLGVLGGLYYNASLNIYYLAVVKYGKKEDVIRSKVEPLLHAVPIAVSLISSILLLVGKHYNSGGWDGSCRWSLYYPPHCNGYDVGEIRDEEGFEEIPCGRGIHGAGTVVISGMVMALIPAITIAISLGLIYESVRKQEIKLSAYGVGSLRANIKQSLRKTTEAQQDEDTPNPKNRSFIGSVKTVLTGRWSSLVSKNTKADTKPTSRSNNTQSQSRAVMHKALGYSFAWFMAYGVNIIALVVQLTTSRYPMTLYYVVYTFVPLQGFFNILIYIYPKVISAKKSKKGGKEVSWSQAVRKAFWSRGNDRNKNKARRGRLSNLRGYQRPKRDTNHTTSTTQEEKPRKGSCNEVSFVTFAPNQVPEDKGIGDV